MCVTLGLILATLANIDIKPPWKNLQGTNTLAYYIATSVTKMKVLWDVDQLVGEVGQHAADVVQDVAGAPLNSGRPEKKDWSMLKINGKEAIGERDN
jgi:hypothetical protein